jgi:thiol:disulfide interchange protein
VSQLFDWTAVALLAGLLTGTFVGFRGAEPRLWMRVVLAFFGLGLLIITPIIAWSVSNGTSMNIPTEPGLVLLALTAFLWFNIIRHALRPRPEPEPGTEPRRWGCFRTLFAIAAFIVVGYAGFVIVVFGLGGLMGLVVAASG